MKQIKKIFFTLLSFLLILPMSYHASNQYNLSVNSNIGLAIQDVFPDSTLASQIARKLRKTVSDQITQSDVDSVTSLYLDNLGIIDATGINTFVNLKKLDLSYNQLTSIDLTGLVQLEGLSLASNQLTTIDLSHLPNLLSLSLQQNQLTTLDLNGLNKLNSLNIFMNSIKDLDLTPLLSLEFVNASNNPLNSIVIEDLPSLATVYINNTTLKQLSLKNLPKLTLAQLERNQLHSLLIDNVPEIVTLNLGFNRLPNVVVEHLSKLETLVINNNLLTEMKVNQLPSLKLLNLNNNRFKTLVVDTFEQLSSLLLANNQLTQIEIKELNLLQELNLSNNQIEFLSLTQLPNLKNANLSQNRLAHLALIELPLLETLTISKNQLTSFEDSFMDLTNLKVLTAEMNLFPPNFVERLKLLMPQVQVNLMQNDQLLLLNQPVVTINSKSDFDQLKLSSMVKLFSSTTLSTLHQFELVEYTNDIGLPVNINDYFKNDNIAIGGTVFAQVKIVNSGLFAGVNESATTYDRIQFNFVKSIVTSKPVIVKYVNLNNETLLPDLILHGTIGESYMVQPELIDGYQLSYFEGNLEGEFNEDEAFITFYYQLVEDIDDEPTLDTPPSMNDETNTETTVNQSHGQLPTTGMNSYVLNFGMIIVIVGLMITLIKTRTRK